MLVNCRIGVEDQVSKEVARIEGVKEVYSTYGFYKVVAKLKAPTPEGIGEIVRSKIKGLNGVKSVLVLLIKRTAKGG